MNCGGNCKWTNCLVWWTLFVILLYEAKGRYLWYIIKHGGLVRKEKGDEMSTLVRCLRQSCQLCTVGRQCAFQCLVISRKLFIVWSYPGNFSVSDHINRTVPLCTVDVQCATSNSLFSDASYPLQPQIAFSIMSAMPGSRCVLGVIYKYLDHVVHAEHCKQPAKPKLRQTMSWMQGPIDPPPHPNLEVRTRVFYGAHNALPVEFWPPCHHRDDGVVRVYEHFGDAGRQFFRCPYYEVFIYFTCLLFANLWWNVDM